MANKHPRHLWIAFAAVVAIILIQNLVIFLSQPAVTGHATEGQGQITLCVNTEPTINLAGCSNISFAGTAYSCYVNATDAQQSSFSYAVARVTGPVAGDAIFTMSGTSWLNFTPNVSHIGNYSLQFTVDDLSGCERSQTTATFDLTINASSNAPYLVTPIPNQTWDANTALLAFDLDDYFDDPNSDPLTYNVAGNTNIGISITSGEVLFSPALNWCGTEEVTFTATDPTNLSATSNTVGLTVNCVSSEQDEEESSADNNGGGGGGGGGFALSCVPLYTCYAWSSCQLVRAVNTITGSSSQIEIVGVTGNQTYMIDPEYTGSLDVFYEGFQYKHCIDTRQCEGAKTKIFVRPCGYEPSCSDGLQNQNEQAVDCGGVCPACGTCTDGIQNSQETGVDCGGPTCASCYSCTDGQLNGEELGVDCGGPSCPACATCFDGLKNQDEERVDCGGNWCKPCEEQPLTIAKTLPWLTIILLVLIAGVMLALFFAVVKRTFAHMLMRFFLKHKKRNRVIILDTHTKDEIIARLLELENALPRQPILRSQEELARIIRDYFRSALQIPFEFTYEELIQALKSRKLNDLLQAIMDSFFTRISYLEFSGTIVSEGAMHALIAETRELVYQTAVLTVDDLKALEEDLQIRDIPQSAPSLDRGYLLLSQVHLALQFRKYDLAAAVYEALSNWYSGAPIREQSLLYDDFTRVYDEYVLATTGGKGASPQSRRGNQNGTAQAKDFAVPATQATVAPDEQVRVVISRVEALSRTAASRDDRATVRVAAGAISELKGLAKLAERAVQTTDPATAEDLKHIVDRAQELEAGVLASEASRLERAY